MLTKEKKINLLFCMSMCVLLESFNIFQVEAGDHSNASTQRSRGVSPIREKPCGAKLQSLIGKKKKVKNVF